MKANYQIVSQEIMESSNKLKEEFNSLRNEAISDQDLPDIEELITYLAETIKVDSLDLFIDYIDWGAELFQSRSYALTLFEEQLQLLLEVFFFFFSEFIFIVID